MASKPVFNCGDEARLSFLGAFLSGADNTLLLGELERIYTDRGNIGVLFVAHSHDALSPNCPGGCFSAGVGQMVSGGLIRQIEAETFALTADGMREVAHLLNKCARWVEDGQ